MHVPYLVLVLAPACTWAGFWVAMKRSFRLTKQKNTAKTWLIVSGYVCAVVQLTVLALSRPTAYLVPWIGIAGFVVANVLFWWSLWAHGKNRPAFAFVPTQPNSFTHVGPYRLVRHPIYTAYLLTWLAGSLLSYNPWLLATFGWMCLLYYRAASQEETTFSTSPFALQYQEYKKQTGMFLPKAI